MADVATGGCLCGAVRFRVEGALRDVIVCHCSVCRRTHGGPAHYTACLRDALTLTETTGLRHHELDGARRGFCDVCGARLFWERPGRETISIAAGAVDPPTGLHIREHIYRADAGDWLESP